MSNQNKNRRSDSDQESATSFVYRLKFSQNPDLKNLLLATGDAFLVHIGPDQIWSDRFDCFGKNKYGCILMQIRGELGGKGPVKSPGSAFMLRDIRKKQIGFEVFTLDVG